MTVTVWTTVSVPGFHRWPDATDARSYLADRHRHLFRITAHVAVAHDDRDVEFHDLQDLIRAWWGPVTRECGASSCEDLARQVRNHLKEDHRLDVVSVEVSEDGESGATVTGVS